MVDALPFQADVSFQEKLPAKHSRISLKNGFDRILTPSVPTTNLLLHRKHMNWNWQKTHLQSAKPLLLHPHPNNLRFQSLKKLLTMIVSHQLTLLWKPKTQCIVLQPQTISLQNWSFHQLKNQKSCTGCQPWPTTCRSPLRSTHKQWICRLLWHNVSCCPFCQKSGVKCAKPLVINEYLGLAHRLHQPIKILWTHSQA